MLGRICSNVSSFCGNVINRIPQGVRQTVHETATETAIIGFNVVAANISQATFAASAIANGAGAIAGAFYETECVRDPSNRISQSESAGTLLLAAKVAGVGAAACFGVFEPASRAIPLL